jgi:hypothetical protein
MENSTDSMKPIFNIETNKKSIDITFLFVIIIILITTFATA